ncbi:MAG: hypothetical protein AB7O37_21955 [Vicinamibacteria bacterium]
MDESVFEFWRLTSRTGYYCHGAVGVPATEYEALRSDLAPVFERYKALIGPASLEFKHRDFVRLPYAQRRSLAVQMREMLAAHGAFIAGFFTPCRSHVLEWVRMDLMDGSDELPEDYEGLLEGRAARLRDDYAGVGQSKLIGRLLHWPITAIGHMLAAFNCPFVIVHDPRETKEDRAVQSEIADHRQLLDALKNLPSDTSIRRDLGDYFRGLQNDTPSTKELGLQLADLVAGEVRFFFQAFPEVMSYGATPKFITPRSREPIMVVDQIGGKLAKSGSVTRMPRALRRRFIAADPKGRTVLPLMRHLFAAGTLTCYSSWGQPRHLMPFDGLIFDQLD